MRRLAKGLVVALLAAAFGSSLPCLGGAKGNYVYVYDRGSTTSQVFGFSMARDGTLTALTDSPFAVPDTGNCGGLCQPMAYAKKRKLLFVSGEIGTSVFRVEEGGGLSLVVGSPFGPGSGDHLGTAVYEKSGRTFVYSTEYDNDQVRGYEVQEDDTLVELDASPFAVEDGPDGMTAVKNNLFVCNENAHSVSSFVINADGTLTEAADSPFTPRTDFSYNVVPDPRGKFLFVGGCGDGNVEVFKIDRRTANLTAHEDGPFQTNLADNCSGLAASKSLVVVPDDNSAPVQVMKRSGDGSLALLGEVQNSPMASGTDCPAFEPKGKFLLLARDTTMDVRVFSVDKRTGLLTQVDNEAVGTVSNLNAMVFVKR
jgi:6-phosphogluconolactonase (cycloisomerase 2 family)